MGEARGRVGRIPPFTRIFFQQFSQTTSQVSPPLENPEVSAHLTR